MKRASIIILSIILVISIMTGCSAVTPTIPPTSAPTISSAPKITGAITFMVLDAMTKNPTDAIFAAAKKFEALYPGTKVTIEPVPSSTLKDKFTNAALAGAGPDVVSLDTGGWIVDSAAVGIIMPLDKSIEPIKNDFQIGSLNAGRYNSQYYAVPWYVNNAGLYYNKTMLKESGITTPPATWAEFEADIKAVTAKGKKGLSMMIDAAYFMYPFFFQNNNFLIDSEKSVPVSTINTTSGQEAFNFFMSIHTKYKGFPESTKDTLSWDQVYAPFIQGEVAFLMSGDWADFTISSAKPKFEYGIAPLPVGKQGGTVMGGYSLSINKNTKNYDTAWKFIEFLTAKEQNNVLLAYSRIGARKDIDTDALIALKPILAPFIKQAKDAYARPAIVGLTDADRIFSDAFKKVYLGQTDTATALAECEKLINALMVTKYKK